MTSARPRTIRERLDAAGAPTDRDPLFVLVLHCLLSVASVLAFGAAVALAAPHLGSPGLFAAAFLVGLPLAFAAPGLVLRRLGIRTGR